MAAAALSPRRWTGRIGIRWQIMLLVVVTQLVAHVTTFTIVSNSLLGPDRQAEFARELADPVLTILPILPPDALPSGPVLAALVAIDPRFTLRDAGAAAADATIPPVLRDAILAAVPSAWAGRVDVVARSGTDLWRGPVDRPFSVIVTLADGSGLEFWPEPGVLARTVPRLIVTLGVLFIVLPIMILAVWAGNALVAPIVRLADGVDAFARDIDAPEVRAEGAPEVRRASRSFNIMRERIRKLVSDRSLTLAAIGHDMRTPLTRLRLRVETQEPADAVRGIGADLAALERMIDDALRFLRAEHQPVRPRLADLAVLCRTVCDDLADQGGAAAYLGPEHLTVTCDPELMQRVLENTVGNAVRHAGGGTVDLRQAGSGVVVEIADTGPGIPAELMSVVTEPFTRLEGVNAGQPGSRSGFGLGLAIARQLMQRQGGSLALKPNDPRGLIVQLALPGREGRAA